MTSFSNKIIVALDVSFGDAVRLVDELGGLCGFYKVGLSLFYESFDRIVDYLKSKGKKVFLDLKLHDIPYQVGRAAKSLSRLEPDFLTVHASSGSESIKSAKESVSEKTKIIAVTVLTSQQDSQEKLVRRVLSLAEEAVSAGADGIVCSGREVSAFKERFEQKIAVVPGVRFSYRGKDDQKRVVLPEEAFRNGADYIVVGREICCSESPRRSFEGLLERLNRSFQ